MNDLDKNGQQKKFGGLTRVQWIYLLELGRAKIAADALIDDAIKSGRWVFPK